jgi:hypothetical protein
MKRGERMKRVRAGRSIFPADITPERLEALLVGRKISWIIRPNKKAREEPLYETARVHHQGFKVVKWRSGLGIEFREAVDDKGRQAPWKYRAVLLNQIHTVK